MNTLTNDFNFNLTDLRRGPDKGVTFFFGGGGGLGSPLLLDKGVDTRLEGGGGHI